MRYLLRRIGFYLVAFWAAITLNFVIPRLAPGDPASLLIGRFRGRIPMEALRALQIQFGVTDEPLWEQYIHYLGQLLHGNLGLSIVYFPEPVSSIIQQELPWTLGLVGPALALSFLIGTALGALIAWKRGSKLDSILPPSLAFLSAIPNFYLALLLIYVLGDVLGWFPTTGAFDRLSFDRPVWSSPAFILSLLHHAVLPVITFVLITISGWMMGMRNAMITTLAEDYILMAEAKGLPDRRIILAYAARNAILPSLTAFTMSLGFVVAGQVFIEIMFSYPGIGFGLFQAIQNADYPLMQGIFLLVTAGVLLANLITDLLYAVLDPRVRQERS